MSTRFRQHGQFRSRIEGRMVITEVEGPWNRELVVNWAAQMLAICTPLGAGGPYIGCAIVHGSLLCPPDALDALRHAISYGIEKLNCIGNVVVADASVEGRAMLQPTYETLYENNSPHAFLYDLDSAREWARNLLAAKGY